MLIDSKAMVSAWCALDSPGNTNFALINFILLYNKTTNCLYYLIFSLFSLLVFLRNFFNNKLVIREYPVNMSFYDSIVMLSNINIPCLCLIITYIEFPILPFSIAPFFLSRLWYCRFFIYFLLSYILSWTCCDWEVLSIVVNLKQEKNKHDVACSSHMNSYVYCIWLVMLMFYYFYSQPDSHVGSYISPFYLFYS